jgi:hypothetical protein
MKIVSHSIDFMVDTGTLDSALTQPVSALSNKHTSINVTGDQVCHPFSMARQCNLGSYQERHESFYLPDCLMGMMDRDLLCKLRTQITFD